MRRREFSFSIPKTFEQCWSLFTSQVVVSNNNAFPICVEVLSASSPEGSVACSFNSVTVKVLGGGGLWIYLGSFLLLPTVEPFFLLLLYYT
mgnify:CR=1 FL=1